MSLFFQGKEVERKFISFSLVSFGLWPPFPLSNWGQTRVCWLSWTRKGSRLIFRRACNTKPTRTVGQKYKGRGLSSFPSLFFFWLAHWRRRITRFTFSASADWSWILSFQVYWHLQLFFQFFGKGKKENRGVVPLLVSWGKRAGCFGLRPGAALLAFLNANSILFRLRKKCHVEKHV